ncbi:uncharacterized protein BO97DRAFT_471714 [Aspergillus homomorphus CBS 101889]|uniref:FAD/NAD(P)-binding domain-containing protein n=1 Tax=Aspergillus homomorphus (strain CBS 101889) TaxID=1450537 RepID=A0A395HR57_ASPHC|nr:hypothetical protein BO97DRAFT_471714 [Aspergillus homomorphus CBS 101889]RAL10441.1 hypothetical protein BO97DRAFT_471714 [Aspergillus homomorphus CBS 101889]
MPPPQKVAIIGLVTAKTLVHNAPPGTFQPTVFEKRERVGGLWGIDLPQREPEAGVEAEGLVPGLMRTNLSRFTVAFSDLDWEATVLDGGGDGEGGGESESLPMFPRAWQVGTYLSKYAELYLPPGVLRLGCEVERVVKGAEGKGWVVRWVERGLARSEYFDYLVVSSGYFSRPYIPDIPGLGLGVPADTTVHSSALQSAADVQRLFGRVRGSGGKLLVVGGSMSGVEAASKLALHLSSMDCALGASSTLPKEQFELHHVCSRPFWTVPTYLPRKSVLGSNQETTVPFLPLDLVFYDLARRPPGQVEYGLGLLTREQISKTNTYFSELLGSDYTRTGSVGVTSENNQTSPQPSWIAIGNDYAEYVRAGTINTTIGRVAAISHAHSSSAHASVEIKLPTGESMVLDDVAAIILATGFTPSESLAYLPPAVLSTLEYSPHDPFIPLILDNKGTTRAEMPDLGFVGFYRGPYWGVMEMQARSLAARWTAHATASADDHPPSSLALARESERAKLRQIRRPSKANPDIAAVTAGAPAQRSQFPMGDYVGLMESFARELDIPRTPLFPLKQEPPSAQTPPSKENKQPLNPIIPARYQPHPQPHTPRNTTPAPSKIDHDITLTTEQVTKTLTSLRKTLSPPRTTGDLSTATAIFRALHGSWVFSRTEPRSEWSTRLTAPTTAGRRRGYATFYPRYTTAPGYEKEYLYTETCPRPQTSDLDLRESCKKYIESRRAVYRLLGDGSDELNGQIRVWNAGGEYDSGGYDDGSGGDGRDGRPVPVSSVGRFSHGMEVRPARVIAGYDDDTAKMEKDMGSEMYVVCASGRGGEHPSQKWEYRFYLEGVSVVRWECVLREEGLDCGSGGGGRITETVYVR